MVQNGARVSSSVWKLHLTQCVRTPRPRRSSRTPPPRSPRLQTEPFPSPSPSRPRVQSQSGPSDSGTLRLGDPPVGDTGGTDTRGGRPRRVKDGTIGFHGRSGDPRDNSPRVGGDVGVLGRYLSGLSAGQVLLDAKDRVPEVSGLWTRRVLHPELSVCIRSRCL